MRLRSAGVVPPTTLLEMDAPMMYTPMATPGLALTRATVPEGSVPRKLPAIVSLPLLVAWTAGPGHRFMTSPRTALPSLPAPSSRPFCPKEKALPSISIRRTASSPAGSVLALAPGCV